MGPFIRCAPIALDLQKKGYECWFYATDDAKNIALKLGLKFVNIPSRPENYINKISNKSWWTHTAELWNLYGYHDKKYLSLIWHNWEKGIVAFNPDCIISDLSIPSYFTAKKNNIPLLSITQSCYTPGLEEMNFVQEHHLGDNTNPKISELVLRNINEI